MKRDVLLVVLLLLTSTSTVSASDSNEILLKSRRFTPVTGVSAAAKAKIEAIPKRAHVLIQLEDTPTIKERKELEANGIKLLAYVPNKAWFASIPSDKVSENLLAGVNKMGGRSVKGRAMCLPFTFILGRLVKPAPLPGGAGLRNCKIPGF